MRHSWCALMKYFYPCLAPGRLPKCLLGCMRSNPTTRHPASAAAWVTVSWPHKKSHSTGARP
eukprot:2355985-Pleurochrysis_carterae.AAC.3